MRDKVRNKNIEMKVLKRERERERERERQIDDIYCDYKVEESRTIGAIKENSLQQYLPWYQFLGKKMKLRIIFM